MLGGPPGWVIAGINADIPRNRTELADGRERRARVRNDVAVGAQYGLRQAGSGSDPGPLPKNAVVHTPLRIHKRPWTFGLGQGVGHPLEALHIDVARRKRLIGQLEFAHAATSRSLWDAMVTPPRRPE